MKTILLITITIAVIGYIFLYCRSKRPEYSEKEATGDNHVFEDI